MIRVFPRRTNLTPDDDLAFVGDPPMEMFLPEQQPVRVSVTFTWDIDEGYRLLREWGKYYTDVEIGGPALNSPCEDFVPGRFVKHGVTFTSRGCCWDCSYCMVRGREGKFKTINPIYPGNIIQDNNVLASSPSRLEKVFEMLREQKQAAVFSGGLDSRLVRYWHRGLFDSVRTKELWFACDRPEDMERLRNVAEIFKGYSINKLRCYTMIGYGGETLEDAKARLKEVYRMGFLPYAQLYQGERRTEWPKRWRDLSRTFSRPAATKAAMKEVFTPLFGHMEGS